MIAALPSRRHQLLAEAVERTIQQRTRDRFPHALALLASLIPNGDKRASVGFDDDMSGKTQQVIVNEHEGGNQCWFLDSYSW